MKKGLSAEGSSTRLEKSLRKRGQKSVTSECTVEDLDEENRDTENNKKYCTKKLKIGAKLSLGEMIKAGLEFIWEKSIEPASSGDNSRLASSGNNSAVANIGINGIAKAAKYSWITLAEHCWEDGRLKLKCVKTEQVDGYRIKSDTWYRLEDGEFREVE